MFTMKNKKERERYLQNYPASHTSTNRPLRLQSCYVIGGEILTLRTRLEWGECKQLMTSHKRLEKVIFPWYRQIMFALKDVFIYRESDYIIVCWLYLMS